MINKRRIQFVLIILVILAVFLNAVVFVMRKTTVGGEYMNEDNRYSVYLIGKAPAENSAFWGSVYSGATAAASEYNMDLHMMAPMTEEDYYAQNEFIQQAIDEGADCIVISSISYEENAEYVDMAVRAGIPVIAIDSDVDSERVSCRIMTDNYQAGYLLGQSALAETEGDLVVGIVNYSIESDNGQQRQRGFEDALSESDRVMQIYAIENCTSKRNVAFRRTVDLLNEHPDINVIVALNEPMSLGAGDAVTFLELEDQMSVFAFDCNIDSVQMLEEGQIEGLVVQSPYSMGYLGIENAYKLANGIRLDSDSVSTAVVFVDRENMYSITNQQFLFLYSDVEVE